MKRFIKSKKGIALLATMVVVGASAFGAYAYFTNSNSVNATPVKVGTVGTLSVVENSAEVSNAPATAATTYQCLNDDSFDLGCAALLPAALNDTNNPTAIVPFTITNGDESTEQLTSYTIAIQNADGSAWFNCTDATPATDTATLCTDGTTPCTKADFSIDGLGAGTSFVSSTGAASATNPPELIALDTNGVAPLAAASPVVELKPFSDAPANTFGSEFTLRLVDNGANQNNCESTMPKVEITTTSA